MRQLWMMLRPLAGRWQLWANISLGISSGLCNFLFIGLVTKVVGLSMAGELTAISREYTILFSLIILLFIWTRRSLSLNIIDLSQKLFWGLRKQILSLVLGASYQQLVDRRVKVYSAIVNDVGTLTQASLTAIDFFTSIILAVSCLFYLAFISLTLLSITICVAIVGIVVYHIGSRKNIQQFEKARSLENRFMKNFNSILDGFKEIYMEPKKGKDIYEQHIVAISSEAYANNRAAFIGFLNNQVTGRILFYLLISTILLYFSITLKIKSADLVSFVFTLLYLLGSIEMIMALLPGIMRAKVASAHLAALKNDLESAELNNRLPVRYMLKNEFEQLTVRDLEFYYQGEENGFGIGPVDLSVSKGEVVFIYGGNGSGKTTLVHTILGLCMPGAGEIRLNDIVVTKNYYPEYRTIFSVLFNDFYLFNELLGISSPDLDKWSYYLKLFELEGKVTLEKNCFSTTDLSAGQKKRLALIAALLEEKPVLILDEWAADQDPYFRKKFYVEIIPVFKREGITIIAITHDDKYYHCADTLYKMDSGKLIRENKTRYKTDIVPIL